MRETGSGEGTGRDMSSTLFMGFKGKNNLSCLLAGQLSRECCLLTNSFSGVKKDIESIDTAYDCVILFGIDKNLAGTVRIERTAETDGIRYSSVLDLEKAAEAFHAAGLAAVISEAPTAYLCNEAYGHLLRKFSGRAVLIHIPTMKNAGEGFTEKVQQALGSFEAEVHRG